MTIDDVLVGFRALEEKGFPTIQIAEVNIYFAKDYMKQHLDQFRYMATIGGNLNPFYDGQDKAFKDFCLGYNSYR